MWISLTGCVLKISAYRTCPRIPLLSYIDYHWYIVWHVNQSSVSGKVYTYRGGSQACEPSQVVDCMNMMYLVNSFVVVCLNLSSSVHAYGSMPVLGVNVCQLITNLSYILNFILCLLCYQSAVSDGTYRLHSCFSLSFVPHSPWLSCLESTVPKSGVQCDWNSVW